MVDIHIWGKQSPPAGKLMTYGVDWLLLTPIPLPPTFSSALPYWAIHSLTQYLHCLHRRSSVLCWFLLPAWCIQDRSHIREAKWKESSRNSKTSESQLCYSPRVWPWKISQTQQVSFLIFNMGTVRVVFTGLLFGFIESISHKRHQALLAEIIRTVRITEWLPSGRRQDSRPETETGGQHGKVLAPDKGIFFSTWVLVP